MKTETINRLAPALVFAVIGLALSAGWINYLRDLAEAATLTV